MDIKRIDLNLLTVFAALLEEENASKAGKRLGLSQPAVSAALARLRTVFADELFIRSSHGLVPTQRAEFLKPEVKSAVEQIRKVFVAGERFVPDQSQQAFRISVDEFVGTTLVPTLSTQIHKLAPLVRVEWLPTSHLADTSRELASGDLDFVIRVTASSPRQIERQRLWREGYVCVVGDAHPRITRRLSLKSFMEETHILVGENERVNRMIERQLELEGVVRQTGFIMPQFAQALFIVASSDLICSVPESLALAYKKFLPIKTFKHPIKLDDSSVVLEWHHRTVNSAPHAWVRDNLSGWLQPKMLA